MLRKVTEATNSSTDPKVFESYGEFINPAYPLFLKKFGLDRVAVEAEGATITDSEGKTYINCVGGYGLFYHEYNDPDRSNRPLRWQLEECHLQEAGTLDVTKIKIHKHEVI